MSYDMDRAIASLGDRIDYDWRGRYFTVWSSSDRKRIVLEEHVYESLDSARAFAAACTCVAVAQIGRPAPGARGEGR